MTEDGEYTEIKPHTARIRIYGGKYLSGSRALRLPQLPRLREMRKSNIDDPVTKSNLKDKKYTSRNQYIREKGGMGVNGYCYVPTIGRAITICSDSID